MCNFKIIPLFQHRFIVTTIKNTLDYNPRLFYWLGGEYTKSKEFEWVDGSRMTFVGWFSGDEKISESLSDPICMGLRLGVSPSPMISSNSNLHNWAYQRCTSLGGYVCKKNRKNNFLLQNQTITGIEGRLTSPDYPNQYASNIDYWIRIVAPEKSRIVLQFQRMDLEHQEECLYDYVSVQDAEFDWKSMQNATREASHNVNSNSVYKVEGNEKSHQTFIMMNNSWTLSSFKSYVRWCGKHESDMAKYTFVSKSNEILFNFYTDYSIAGEGFSAIWRSVDISACPGHTFTSSIGQLSSPNYPFFLLHNLNCTYSIQAPSGRRIWIEFNDFEIINDAKLVIQLGDGTQIQPHKDKSHIADGFYSSYDEKVTISLTTGSNPQGKGFKLTYKTSEYKKFN